MDFREKRHRLPSDYYKGMKTVSFIFCIKDRNQVFINNKIFSEFEKLLIEELDNNSCKSYAYLFMPDHLHLIAFGESEESDIIKAVNSYKQKTGYWFYQNMNHIKWQKDYYDHIIRNDGDLKKHIYYVLNNPVRKGICNNWKDYNFKGSQIYNFDDWV